MGNINALNLVDMVIILKSFGNKFLCCNMFLQGFLCSIFIELERNDKIGTERTRKLAFDNNLIAAVRAGCCARC